MPTRLLAILAALFVALPTAAQVLDFGHVKFRSTACSGQAGAIQRDLCHQTTDETIWACDTATCEGAGWVQVGGGTTGVTGIVDDDGCAGGEVIARNVGDTAFECAAEGSAAVSRRAGPGAPNGATGHGCTPGAGGSCSCDTSLVEEFLDTSTGIWWRCTNAFADQWAEIPPSTDTVRLAGGETAVQNRLIALGSTNPAETIVAGCSLTATRDGIVCDPSSVAGQSIMLCEDTDHSGAECLSIDVGAINLSGDAAWSVTTDGSLDLSRGVQFPMLSAAPVNAAANHATLYVHDVTGTPELHLWQELGYDWTMLSGDLAANRIPRALGGSDLVDSFLSHDASHNQIRVDEAAGTQYFKLEALNSDAAPDSSACNETQEVGNLIAKGGASVTGDNGALCLCTYEASAYAWECHDGSAAGGDSPGGNNGEMQYRVNGTTLGGVANLETDGTDPTLIPQTSHPSAPSSGSKLYSFTPSTVLAPMVYARPPTPGFPIVPLGLPDALQGGWRCALPAGINSPTLTTWGWVNTQTTYGTATPASWVSSTLLGRTPRALLRSGTTTDDTGGLRANNAQAWRGDAAGRGGWYMQTAFGIETAQTNQRTWLVMKSGTGTFLTATDPSAQINFAGFYCDSTQTTFRVGANDGSGTVASPTDLGADFPCATAGAYYQAALWAEPNESNIHYAIHRLDTTVTAASGTVPTGDGLPGSTLPLSWDFGANTATASGVATDMALIGACIVPGI